MTIKAKTEQVFKHALLNANENEAFNGFQMFRKALKRDGVDPHDLHFSTGDSADSRSDRLATDAYKAKIATLEAEKKMLSLDNLKLKLDFDNLKTQWDQRSADLDRWDRAHEREVKKLTKALAASEKRVTELESQDRSAGLSVEAFQRLEAEASRRLTKIGELQSEVERAKVDQTRVRRESNLLSFLDYVAFNPLKLSEADQALALIAEARGYVHIIRTREDKTGEIHIIADPAIFLADRGQAFMFESFRGPLIESLWPEPMNDLTTSEWVTKITYTPDEAAEEWERIDQGVADGKVDPASATKHKAWVTRRRIDRQRRAHKRKAG